MGGAQSQQVQENRIILERESFNVVHVSEDVISRLKNGNRETTTSAKTQEGTLPTPPAVAITTSSQVFEEQEKLREEQEKLR